MKSPLPLLAIGAALLVMRSKKGSGSGSEEVKDNVLEVTANSAIPFLQGPYIQVTSSFPADFISVGELEDVVRPVAEQNLDLKFVISAADGLDRLQVSQHADLTTPDQFTVMAMHADSELPQVVVIAGPDATLTTLYEEVAAAAAYLRAPFSANG